MKGMTVIVKTISSWVKILIFVFGIYIVITRRGDFSFFLRAAYAGFR
jgi:hypothetical protein